MWTKRLWQTTYTRLLNGLIPGFYSGDLQGIHMTCGIRAGLAPVESYVGQVGSVFQNPKTQYFNADSTDELAFPCENTGMSPRGFGNACMMSRSSFTSGIY